MQTSKRTLTEDESKLNETYVGATVLYVASMFTLMVEVGGEGPGGAGGEGDGGPKMQGALFTLQDLPFARIASPQQFSSPPGREPHPLPEHEPQELAQHSFLEESSTPWWQEGSAPRLRDE